MSSRGLLDGAVPILEYGFRRIVERARGAGATERSRIMPEVRSMIQEINDPVFYREALRLAAEALGVSPAMLEAADAGHRTAASPRRTRRSDPHTEAGSAVLALILARPELATDALQKGIRVPAFAEPFSLRAEDFREEAQARIFALLREHAGRDLDAVLSDERARPLMDQIGALAAKRREALPVRGLHSGGLAAARDPEPRARQARDVPTTTVRRTLQSEIQALKEALRAVCLPTLEAGTTTPYNLWRKPSPVAQLAEHSAVNRRVAGSSPAGGASGTAPVPREGP